MNSRNKNDCRHMQVVPMIKSSNSVRESWNCVKAPIRKQNKVTKRKTKLTNKENIKIIQSPTANKTLNCITTAIEENTKNFDLYSKFTNYQQMNEIHNQTIHSNEISELITPKSNIENKDSGCFFRLKRQLHKSNLCNVSNELASAERLKDASSNHETNPYNNK